MAAPVDGLQAGEDMRALYEGPAVAEVPSAGGAAAPPRATAERAGCLAGLKRAVKRLKRDVLALHYATQDARLGALPRVVAVLAIAYALSPLDLIPDFIPVLGLVDDVLVLGALLYLAFRLVPPDVLQDARRRAEREPLRLRKNWGMALLFFLLWDCLALWLVWWACGLAGRAHPAVLAYRAWAVAGAGVLLAAGEAAWAAAQWRHEARVAAVLAAAGAQPELEEALLAGGGEAVQAYLEP